MTFPRLLACLLAATCPGAEIMPMWWSDPPSPAPGLAVDEGEAKPRPVRLLRLCPLERLRGKAGEPWTLLRQRPAEEPGQPPTWVPYVSVRLPEKAGRVAVLVVPTEPPQALAVDLSESGHRWGTVRLVNLTGAAVEGWIGRRRLRLPPGGQAASEAATERRTEELVLFAVPDGAERSLLLSSRAILDPRRRSVVFLARLADGRLETRALEESKAEDAEASGAPR
jgi:hypothetical protein